MIYLPHHRAGIGNIIISYSTHIIATNGKGGIDSVIYKHGRDKILTFKNVVENGVINSKDSLNSFTHLRFPNIGSVMREYMKPTEYMQTLIDKHWKKVDKCVAGFHIRRGTLSEDSSKFAFYPTASDKAVESMIKMANDIDEPVFIISDSITTKRYFQSKVPKAISLDLDIGYTSCEFSQEYNNPVKESLEIKYNSMIEWFLMSKMSKIYTTMGGNCGINIPEGEVEGISSTFVYSAALYGDKIPYYVFNDGVIFYPDGRINSPRLTWSDSYSGDYIVLNNPTKDKIMDIRKNYPLWIILVNPDTCKENGIYEWCKTRVNVDFTAVNDIPHIRKMINVD